MRTTKATRKATAPTCTALVALPNTQTSYTAWPKVGINYAPLRAQRVAALQAAARALGAAPVAPATPVAAPQLNAASYALGGNWQAVVARAGLQTRQRVTKGTTDWHKHATLKPNTRAVVLSTVSQTLGATFTYDQWAAALAPLAANGTLGSGTPRSYFVAFVKCGYIVAQGA